MPIQVSEFKMAGSRWWLQDATRALRSIIRLIKNVRILLKVFLSLRYLKDCMRKLGQHLRLLFPLATVLLYICNRRKCTLPERNFLCSFTY